MTEFHDNFFSDVPRGVFGRRGEDQQPPAERWMRIDEIERSGELVYDPNNPGAKILVGAVGDRLIGIDDPRHILTVAGSRSGKSVTLIGNLKFYRGSALVMDPKAEVAGQTARRRDEVLGQKVYVLDPFGESDGDLLLYRSAYNPMTVLDLKSRTFLEDASLLAESLVLQGGEEKDPHWNESARNLIEAFIVHVASDPAYEGKRHLTKVRDLLKTALLPFPGRPPQRANDERPLEEIFPYYAQMLTNGAHLRENKATFDIGSALIGAAIDFYSKPSDERGSVHSSAGRHTKFLDYSAFRDIMEASHFDLRDLKRHPQGLTIYLCFPATRIEISRRWLRIFINQLLQAMQEEKATPVAAPVLVCLDEFPILGYMPQLETAAGLVASLSLKLWIILQDWGQGEALYRKRWETFVGNAGILQFFGNNDLNTTEYLSKRLGRAPIEISQSDAKKAQTGSIPRVEYHSLLSPGEITRLLGRKDRLRRQIVYWTGFRPMLLQRVEYYKKTDPLGKLLP